MPAYFAGIYVKTGHVYSQAYSRVFFFFLESIQWIPSSYIHKDRLLISLGDIKLSWWKVSTYILLPLRSYINHNGFHRYIFVSFFEKGRISAINQVKYKNCRKLIFRSNRLNFVSDHFLSLTLSETIGLCGNFRSDLLNFRSFVAPSFV